MGMAKEVVKNITPFFGADQVSIFTCHLLFGIKGGRCVDNGSLIGVVDFLEVTNIS
jgi:hypothetical protein